jgi:integrase
MQWGSINLAEKLIAFTPSKTSRSRRGTKAATIVTVPLHPDLERQLLKAPGVGKAFLFPSLAGRGTGGKTGLSSQFAAIMNKAGIAGVITQHTVKGRKNSSLSFHSLRHSFNSAMANAGIAQEVRQKLTGHASAAQNTTYTHLQLAPLRAAIATIPSIAVK